MCQMASNPYTGIKGIVDIMVFLGAISMVAIILALFLSEIIRKEITEKIINYELGFFNFLFWLFIAIVLSYANSPQETIFEKAYTHSVSLFEEFNFNFASSWTISYSILIYLYSDYLLDQSQKKKLKKYFLLTSLIYISVFLQILKGDREIFTLIVSIYLLNLHYNGSHQSLNRYKILFFIFFFGLVLFLVAYLVALFRTGANYNFSEIKFSNAIAGTWSAVLLTPLSVAGDFYYGLLKFKNGETYINLVLSIIPGFLADAIGYIRPIDGNNGPAWEMRYGQGGTHAVVVPFMNFGFWGVFWIIFIITKLLIYIDKISQISLSRNNLSLYGILLMIIPHWVWYGEKYLINAFIIWVILGFSFSLSSFFFRLLNK